MTERSAVFLRYSLMLGALTTALLQTSVMAQPDSAVGSCPLGAKMELASGQYGGTLSDLLQQSGFARAYRIAADSMPTWAAKDFLSSRNRRYTAGGAEIIIAVLCKRDACATERAYFAYSLPTQTWGGTVLQGRHVIEIGQPVMPGSATQVMPDDVAKAVICARNLDSRN